MSTGVTGVDLVAAIATDAIAFSGASLNTKTVTIGQQVYTCATTPGAGAYTYKPGDDLTEAALYLSECINASGTAGNFGTATVANPDVTASISVDGTIILTAKVAGSLAGGLYLGTDETNGAVGGAYMNACAGTDGSGSLTAAVTAAKTGMLDPKSKTLNFLNEII